MRRMTATIVFSLAVSPLAVNAASAQDAPTASVESDRSTELSPLERRLLDEGVAALAEAARKEGDPVRGAVAFYQPQLACTKCHGAGDEGNPLGPDLAKPEGGPLGDRSEGARREYAQYLVESVLDPSRKIRKGYETAVLVLDDGRQITGLVSEERDGTLVLRDPARGPEPIEIPLARIDQRATSPQSLMPQGQVGQLGSRQQFLDLVAYLIEIAEQGPARAEELKPPASLYALPPLPEYEAHIDHAGLIRSLGDESFERGRAIYERVCANCHGTPEQIGSLPTSLRFNTGKFRNGADPFAMYQTLTHGYGMMVPQSWMVPRQKYDVIHFIRQAYLRPLNPSQFTSISDEYLASLPHGDTRGPEPSEIEPWVVMDYGPSLINTYEIGSDGTNFAYKGIAMRLDPGPGGVSRGRAWMVFDHDTLRVAAAWSADDESDDSRFIDYQGIHFNGQHQVHPHIVGNVSFANPTGPGWADPETGSFEDPRLRGRDGKPYGPLPRKWAHYTGLYHYGGQSIVSYRVGDTPVWEMPGLEWIELGGAQSPAFTRSLQVGPRERELVLVVATMPGGEMFAAHNENAETARSVVFVDRKRSRDKIQVASIHRSNVPDGVLQFTSDESGRLLLKLPPGREPLRFDLSLVTARNHDDAVAIVKHFAADRTAPIDLKRLTHGGPPHWPEPLVTFASIGEDDRPLTADELTLPTDNPWFAQMRLTGFDFFPDGDRVAVSAWDGDVWLVSGLARLAKATAKPASDDDSISRPVPLTWRRIASGLFQPLGVKIVDGRIFVTCRDQIVILNDLNGDGETDYYQNFNNDHQVTDHFHEFAMGLQTDAEGNFYYTKAARHALPALVPQHGTLLRVSRDGSRTDILATGFRAPNGVCVNGDGTFIVSDQEGHWIPKNRINWVEPGKFYGNMMGYHDVTDTSDDAMEQPVCWITNSFDRSPAELLWVPKDFWGSLGGSLLNLSYGYGKVYVVPHERIDGQVQGGMCELPVGPFPTGIMRGRFHPTDGQLYVCGMFAWAGSATQPGGFYRIRRTDKPVHVPIELHAREGGMELVFSAPLDRATAADASRYRVKVWSLKRTANYGSDHINERPLEVHAVRVSDDGRSVFVELPDLQPTWCMEIRCRLKSADGEAVNTVIHNTVHHLGDFSP